MLKLVSDHFKTKKMYKHAVKKLQFVVRYVPEWYNTQEMCDKHILGNDRTKIKNQKMCYKAVGNCVYALEFVSDCYKNQKMCNKVVNIYPSAIQFIPEC